MKKINTLFLFFTFFSGSVFSIELPEIEVVGTSLLPGLGIESSKLPYDIKTFAGDSIGEESSLGLSDYMSQSIPGIYNNEVQGSPYQGDITYRGFRASSTLGAAQGISVYIDGIRVNEPFGDVVNWDMIPEFAINNVSLIPGSNPMYGLNTLGGAISLTTKTALSSPGINTKISYGSFDRKKIDLSVGGKLSHTSNVGSYFLSFSHFNESGWRDYSNGKVSNIFGKASKNTSFGSIGVMTFFGDSDLLGNGLLPSIHYGVEDNIGQTEGIGLYEARRSSVYSHPDQTKNEIGLISLNFANYIDDDTEISGLIYHRYGRQKRLGGDLEAEFDFEEQEYEFQGEFNNTKTRQNSNGLGINFSKILGVHQINAGFTFDQSTVDYKANEIEDCELDNTRKVICFADSDSDDTAKVSGNSQTYSLFTADTFEIRKNVYVTTAIRYNRTKVSNTCLQLMKSQNK
jgi:outer membrane receptor for monomeric catechols